MADDLTLKLILKATDKMSAVVKQAVKGSNEDFEKLSGKLNDLAGKFNNVGKSAGIAGGVLAGFAGVNAKLAGDFEAQMNNVSTLIDTNVESLAGMKKEILKIHKETPASLNDLTEGLYSIRSAGISAEEQFNVLRGSAKLAAAGLATTAEAVDLSTSAINAFNLKGNDAEKVYDTFFKVVKYGKTNVSEFAQGFGAVAGVVSSANIPLDEYSAAVAAMTTSGLKANIAHTQMKAVIAGLTRATDDQVAVFNQLGASSFKDLVNKSGGMVNALAKIKDAVNGDEAQIIALTGSVEAYNAVMSLTGANNQTFRTTLDDIRNGSNALEEGYNKQLDGFNNQMAILKNNMQDLGITLGNALLPVLNPIVKGIRGIVGFIGSLPKPLTGLISIGIAGAGALLLGLSSVSFALGGAVNGFSTMLAIGRNVLGFLPVLKAGLLSLKTGLITSILPAVVPLLPIIAGIGLAAFAIIKFWNPIKGFFRGLFIGLKEGLAPFAPMFSGIAQAVKTVFNWFKRLLSPINTAGKASENFGIKIGKALGGAITWCAKLIKNIFTLGGLLGKKNKSQSGSAAHSGGIDVSVDGSHAGGLSRVPFNGYVAELHKDEAVLTKEQAAEWRQSQTNTNHTITINYSPSISGETKDIMQTLKSHSVELAQMVENVLRRREARSYV